MALGFIKKIFSFGKKEVEEVPAEAQDTVEALAPPGEAPVLEERPDAAAPDIIEAPEVRPEAAPIVDDAVSDDSEKTTPAVVEESAEEADREEEVACADLDVSGPAEAVADIVESPMGEAVIEPVELPAPEAPVAEPERDEPELAELTQPEPAEPAESELAETPETVEIAPEPAVEEPLETRFAAPEEEAPQSDVIETVDTLPSEDLSEPATPPPAPEPQPENAAPVAAPVSMPETTRVTVAKAVEAKKADEPQPAEPARRVSWFERLRRGLSRSSQQLGDSIGGIFTKRKLDEDTLQDLEDVLIQADLGMETAIRITDALSSTRYGKDISTEEVRTIMASEIEKVLAPVAKPLELDLSHKPHVILVVGVNGTGKTTTIGKLAAKLTAGGLSVMLAAGDTFRAAAIEQLHIWGKRTGAPVVSSKLGADAAGLAFDAWKQAKETGSDVLIIDTAGRLQNRAELMDELAKVVRVLGKNDPEAPHTVLQTLDATTGQNALNQVEIFRNVAGVNGLVMTKLDGTARGGILVAISAKHKLPVYFIGVGEQVDDLEPFAARDFAKAIAGTSA